VPDPNGVILMKGSLNLPINSKPVPSRTSSLISHDKVLYAFRSVTFRARITIDIISILKHWITLFRIIVIFKWLKGSIRVRSLWFNLMSLSPKKRTWATRNFGVAYQHASSKLLRDTSKLQRASG